MLGCDVRGNLILSKFHPTPGVTGATSTDGGSGALCSTFEVQTAEIHQREVQRFRDQPSRKIQRERDRDSGE